MLKWIEIKYMLNGMKCTVIFDTPDAPYLFEKYTGVIKVGELKDSIAILTNPLTGHVMSPPWYATVIVHPPEDIKFW